MVSPSDPKIKISTYHLMELYNNNFKSMMLLLVQSQDTFRLSANASKQTIYSNEMMRLFYNQSSIDWQIKCDDYITWYILDKLAEQIPTKLEYNFMQCK